MRHADAACGMRQQMAIVGIQSSDSMCADEDAFCREDADAENRIAPCSDSNRIRTRIGQEIPRSDVNIEVFSQVSKWQRR